MKNKKAYEAKSENLAYEEIDETSKQNRRTAKTERRTLSRPLEKEYQAK
jgi:hypothetical protein